MDNRPFYYNILYEKRLHRWGTDQERSDIQQLAYALYGSWAPASITELLDRIHLGLDQIIADDNRLSAQKRELLRLKAQHVQSLADLYLILDQLEEHRTEGIN